MQHFSKKSMEKRREESRNALEEHKLREERFRLEDEKKRKRKNTFKAIAIGVLIVLGALTTYAFLSPGEYDDFAKCLTDKGAVMYGEDWCQYTNGQKAMFGKSFKYINYHVKTDLEIRPTWIINGEEYKKVQSFQTLAALTGCEY